MNPNQLKAIKERAEKATPGPWSLGEKDKTDWDSRYIWGPEDGVNDGYVAKVVWDKDIDFIAHARTDIPALLEALVEERARGDFFAAITGEVTIDGYEWGYHKETAEIFRKGARKELGL